MSFPELAKKYNLSVDGLKHKASREKWHLERGAVVAEKMDKRTSEIIEKNLDIAEKKNEEHQKLASNAVKLTALVLNQIALEYNEAKKNGNKRFHMNIADLRFAVKALRDAVNLERVAVGLPTNVSHTDVTSKGKSITPVQNILQDKKVINLIKELHIDARQLESLGAGSDIDQAS